MYRGCGIATEATAAAKRRPAAGAEDRICREVSSESTSVISSGTVSPSAGPAAQVVDPRVWPERQPWPASTPCAHRASSPVSVRPLPSRTPLCSAPCVSACPPLSRRVTRICHYASRGFILTTRLPSRSVYAYFLGYVSSLLSHPHRALHDDDK